MTELQEGGVGDPEGFHDYNNDYILILLVTFSVTTNPPTTSTTARVKNVDILTKGHVHVYQVHLKVKHCQTSHVQVVSICICICIFIFRDTTANTQNKQLTRITNNKIFRYGNTKYQTAPKDYPKETVFLSRGSPN